MTIAKTIFVRAQYSVSDQQQAEFEQAALALRDQAKSESGTLTYRWFTAGAGSYVVIEEYSDTAAAMAHNEGAAMLLARVAQCAQLVSAEVYGAIGPQIREWVQANPQATALPDFPDGD